MRVGGISKTSITTPTPLSPLKLGFGSALVAMNGVRGKSGEAVKNVNVGRFFISLILPNELLVR
jgi:hypothetical protein